MTASCVHWHTVTALYQYVHCYVQWDICMYIDLYSDRYVYIHAYSGCFICVQWQLFVYIGTQWELTKYQTDICTFMHTVVAIYECINRYICTLMQSKSSFKHVCTLTALCVFYVYSDSIDVYSELWYICALIAIHYVHSDSFTSLYWCV